MVTKPASALCQPLGRELCLDFVNTVDRSTHKPWVERVHDYADLCAFTEEAGSLAPARVRKLAQDARSRPAEAETVLARARALREATYRLCAAIAHGKAPAQGDLDAVNTELALALGHARVERTADGFAWSWDPDASALDAPLWPIALSAAELVVSPRLARLKECAGDTCLWLFIDQTKNQKRRWCEMKTCGNRAKVREHRRRKQAAPPARPGDAL